MSKWDENAEYIIAGVTVRTNRKKRPRALKVVRSDSIRPLEALGGNKEIYRERCTSSPRKQLFHPLFTVCRFDTRPYFWGPESQRPPMRIHLGSWKLLIGFIVPWIGIFNRVKGSDIETENLQCDIVWHTGYQCKLIIACV